MTLKQARQVLSKLGFKFEHKNLDESLRFGTKVAENIDVHPNHFKPKFRTVWIGAEAKGRCRDKVNGINFLVSGAIKGTYRKYRARHEYDREFGYISGLGKTLEEAVNNFVVAFNNQTNS